MKIFLNIFRLRKLGFLVCYVFFYVFECFGEEVRSVEFFFCVLVVLGKIDLFRIYEVFKIRVVLDILGLF